MKKHFLFLVFVGVCGASSLAQSPVQLDPAFMRTNPTPFVSPLLSQFQAKRPKTNWFCFLEAADANQGGVLNFTVFDNNTLFPDSFVQQAYGDSASGYHLGRVNLHHIGQVFDPTSFYYSDLISPYDPYSIDSISIAYRYRHTIPGSVDTLKFQVYEDAAIKTGDLLIDNKPEPSAWIDYDRANDRGAGALQEWKIPIEADDSSWNTYRVMKLALPNIAQISKGGLFAVTYCFIPGYTYTLGDTIDHTWTDPAPTKKLNQFQPLIGTDNLKSEEYSYNHALSLLSYTKYSNDTTQPFANSFIPGDVWLTFTEYTYIGFHVTVFYIGLAPIAENSVQVYPNPGMDSEKVTISFTTSAASDVTVELYDLLGNKVQTVMNGTIEAGEQVAEVNTTALPSGIYVYRIKAGEQTLSGKLGIVN